MTVVTFLPLKSPHNLEFQGLPDSVQVRDIRDDPTWVVPTLVRRTRFPMTGPLNWLEAKSLLKKVHGECDQTLLIAWCWDTFGMEEKIRFRFFRGPLWWIDDVGRRDKPEWYLQFESVQREETLTIWDRLMGDDIV